MSGRKLTGGEVILGWGLVFALLVAVAVVLSSCVTRVQVCTSYDRRLGRETIERYARDNVGASVCADIEPPAQHLQRENEYEEEDSDAGG